LRHRGDRFSPGYPIAGAALSTGGLRLVLVLDETTAEQAARTDCRLLCVMSS